MIRRAEANYVLTEEQREQLRSAIQLEIARVQTAQKVAAYIGPTLISTLAGAERVFNAAVNRTTRMASGG